MSHFIEPMRQAVRFVYQVVATFGQFNFPGTDLPIFAFIVGAWAIYFFLRWTLAQVFDVETKK